MALSFFAVGVVLLLFSLVIFWRAFNAPNLTRSHWILLRWLLPLTSGCAAGALTGALTVESSGLIPGTVVTGTGGLAVWFISLFIFKPPEAKEESAEQTGPAQAERKVLDLKRKISDIRGKALSIETYGERAAAEVREEAPKLAEQILNFSDMTLSLAYQITKYQYGAYAYGVAAHVESAQRQRLAYAQRMVDSGQKALQLIDLVMEKAANEGAAQELYQFLTNDDARERTQYVVAVGFAIMARELNGTSVRQTREILSKIPQAYLDRYPPQTNPDLAWVLAQPK